MIYLQISLRKRLHIDCTAGSLRENELLFQLLPKSATSEKLIHSGFSRVAEAVARDRPTLLPRSADFFDWNAEILNVLHRTWRVIVFILVAQHLRRD